MVEFENPGSAGKPARRMLVALTTTADELWFFKLTGPADVVEH